MDIRIQELPRQVTRIVLDGHLDSTGAVEIELPFNAAVTAKRAVLVDLTSVTFLSSFGVRLLLVGAKVCAERGGKLVVLCPAGPVTKVLRIARFDALAPVVDSEEAALAALA
jgi:anti-anti-sigma factor